VFNIRILYKTCFNSELLCYDIDTNKYINVPQDEYDKIINDSDDYDRLNFNRVIYVVCDNNKEINDSNTESIAIMYCWQKLRYLDYLSYVCIIDYYSKKYKNLNVKRIVKDFKIIYDDLNGNNLNFSGFVNFLNKKYNWSSLI